MSKTANTRSSSKSGATSVQDDIPLTKSTVRSISSCPSSSSSPYADACLETLEKRLMESFSKVLTEKLHEMKAEITSRIDEIVATLDDEVKNIKFSNNAIRHELASLQHELDDFHRQHRLNDMVITGVPERKKENVERLLTNIASVINHSATPYIDAFRLKAPTQTSPGVGTVGTGSSGRKVANAPIIVRFPSRSEKRAFFKALKTHGPLKLNQIDINFSSESVIRFNDSLTRRNHNIFREACRLRSLNKLHSVTSRNGFVYVKNGKDDEYVRVPAIEKLPTLTTETDATA